jgi:hypothetical protein
MFVRRTVIAAALVAVPLAFAAPALAESGSVTTEKCTQHCVRINPTGNGPLITGVPTWESVWPDPEKDPGAQGPWEKFTGNLSGSLNSALGGLGGLLGGNA